MSAGSGLKPMTGGEEAVLEHLLALYRQDAGVRWHSAAKLDRPLGLSRRTTQVRLARLLRLGLVECSPGSDGRPFYRADPQSVRAYREDLAVGERVQVALRPDRRTRLSALAS